MYYVRLPVHNVMYIHILRAHVHRRYIVHAFIYIHTLVQLDPVFSLKPMMLHYSANNTPKHIKRLWLDTLNVLDSVRIFFKNINFFFHR